MAVATALSLFAVGIAAAAVLLCAFLVYKQIVSKRTASRDQAAARAENQKFPKQRHSSVQRDSSSHRESSVPYERGFFSATPAAAARVSNGVTSSTISISTRDALCSEIQPATAEAENKDFQCLDESDSLYLTRSALTGEEWSIGRTKYIYNPREFFLSGEVTQDTNVQQQRRENKLVVGAWLDEWGHPCEQVSSWVEDSLGGGWRPVDQEDPPSSELSPPRSTIAMPYSEVDAQGGGWRGEVTTPQNIVCSWVEDSEGGGWKPVEEECELSPDMEAAMQDGVFDSCADHSQGGGWRPVEENYEPLSGGEVPMQDDVVDSFAEYSLGGGWRPVEKEGLPSKRREPVTSGCVNNYWIDDSEGGFWRLVESRDPPADVEHAGTANHSTVYWVKDPGVKGWRRMEREVPLCSERKVTVPDCAVDSWAQDVQERGSKPVKMDTPFAGEFYTKPTYSQEQSTNAVVDKVVHDLDNDKDSALSVNCSLGCDLCSSGKGSWGGSSGCETFQTKSDISLLDHGESCPPFRSFGDNLNCHYFSENQVSKGPTSLSLEKVTLDTASSLGTVLSTIEEAKFEEDLEEEDQLSITFSENLPILALVSSSDYEDDDMTLPEQVQRPQLVSLSVASGECSESGSLSSRPFMSRI